MTSGGLPPRSALVVPAAAGSRLDRAPLRGADQVVVDLEDAVAEQDKDTARAAAVAALTSPGWDDVDVAVRINGWESAHTSTDVTALLTRAAGRFGTLVLAKTESAAHVQALDLLVSSLERAVGQPVGGVRLCALVESAAGLLAVDRIAAATPRLGALVLGPLDLAGDLDVPADDDTDEPLPELWREDALRRLALAGRAHGLTVLDGPSFSLDDVGAVRRAATRARRSGCDGCWVVHPSQVQPVHEAFAPTSAEVEQARAVLELVTADAAVVRSGGRMLDTASLRRARSVLARTSR